MTLSDSIRDQLIILSKLPANRSLEEVKYLIPFIKNLDAFRDSKI